MCGILGHVYKDPAPRLSLSEGDLSRISHSWPDGTGTCTNNHVQFGHKRQAIINLTDAGRQPMQSHHGVFVYKFVLLETRYGKVAAV